MTEILHVVGARPNFMKMAPVHRALGVHAGVTSRILHTGQHYDRLMSDVFFEKRDCAGDLLGASRGLMGRRFPPIGQNPVLLAAGWDGRAGERIATAVIGLA